MSQSLSEKSYNYIRRQLESGQLAPGVRLVNRTLAEDIGVSVIPVREAIHRLASEGLVQHVPGAGAFVRNPSRQDLDNLYVLRDALESCAAAEAARHITDDELHQLQLILERANATVSQMQAQKRKHSTKRQLDRWLDDEQQFHSLLIEASRNALLAKVVDDNRAIGSVFAAQRNSPQLLTVEIAQATCQSKAELIEALRDRDPATARQLMSQQIQHGRKIVMEYFTRQRSGL